MNGEEWRKFSFLEIVPGFNRLLLNLNPKTFPKTFQNLDHGSASTDCLGFHYWFNFRKNVFLGSRQSLDISLLSPLRVIVQGNDKPQNSILYYVQKPSSNLEG